MDISPLEKRMSGRPGDADALSDVLDSVRLRSLGASRHEFTAPWGIRIPGQDDAPTDPGAPHNGTSGGFYAITSGACVLEVDNRPRPAPLREGDIVVMIQEQGHQVRDGLTSAVKPLGQLHPEQNIRTGVTVAHGGGGAMTTFIAGGFRFEDWEYNRLFCALPPFIHIPGTDSETVRWLEYTLQFVGRETTAFQPGTQSLLNKISHIVFVQAIRAHVAKLPANSNSWLTSLLDPDIGLAISTIHGRPEHPWTVASLADAVTMSRSAFSAKFTSLVGEPPLHYLSRVRLDRAATILENGRSNVKQVALCVGYESEASFSKAFKRVYGVAPGLYRKQVSAQRRRTESVLEVAAPADISGIVHADRSQASSLRTLCHH